jgi:F420-non-reducing hydrogenase iron-sulfur subunit
MCTGRVDLAFILRALLNGKDGVLIGGCWPGECHYVTEGNYLALSTLHIARKLLELIGINPERVRLEWISASEGSRYAEIMNDFSRKLKSLGPIGKGEGIAKDALQRRLEAAYHLVSYIKLVERERMRVPEKSVEAYRKFFASDEFDRLFRELVADKLEMCQIVALLREKPCSARELSEILGVEPGEVSLYLTRSARQGFIEFDQSRNCFAPV